MTVKDIFNAIKDYEDLDIWIDDGDQMWSADGTKETAQEMLDAIEEGARVEARIYYDEDGNRVPSSEYSSNVDVETIFDSDDFIVSEYDDKMALLKQIKITSTYLRKRDYLLFMKQLKIDTVKIAVLLIKNLENLRVRMILA